MYDRETAKTCLDIINKRYQEVRQERNRFEKTKGHAIFLHPFNENHYENRCKFLCDNLFDMMQEALDHLDHVKRLITEGVLDPSITAESVQFSSDERELGDFLRTHFPDEVKANDGELSVAKLTMAIVNGLMKEKKVKAKA